MTTATELANAKRGQPARGCRVSERFSCDVPVSCQPPSAWGGREIKWQARVKDVSSGGLCLILRRRFERGAGLTIDLPSVDGSAPCTILARVVHVRAEHGGSWALGCSFISPLSDEELYALRCSTQEAEPVAPSPPVKTTVPRDVRLTEVSFRGFLPDGGIVERHIRTLAVDAAWPPPVGRTFRLRFRGADGFSPLVPVRVDACRQLEGNWILECTFLVTPPDALLMAHAEKAN